MKEIEFRAASWCGNQTVDPGEACDDGNPSIGDGCRPDCTLEICGDDPACIEPAAAERPIQGSLF